jgi:lysozyme-like protein
MGDPYPGKIKYLGDTKVQLTYEETAAAVAIGGWPQALWPKAVAVAAAESDRIANVYNTYLDGHYGLFQIGKQQHPDYFSAMSNPSDWIDPRTNAGEAYKIYQSQGWGAWQSATNGRYAGYLLQATAGVKIVTSHLKSGTLAPKAPPAYGPFSDADVLASFLAQKGDGIIARLQAIEIGQWTTGTAKAIAGGAGAGFDTAAAAGESAAQVAASMQSNALFGFVQMMVGAGAWVANPQNWIRVAQVFAGGALLIAGISIAAKPLTGAVAPVGKIAKVLK